MTSYCFKFIVPVLFVILSPSVMAQAAFDLDTAMTFNITGVMAQRMRLALVAENLANASTLRDEETGLPWQKRYLKLIFLL